MSHGPEQFIKIDSYQFIKTVYSWLFLAIGLMVVVASITHFGDFLPSDPDRTELLQWLGSIRTLAILVGLTAAKMGRAKVVTVLFLLTSVLTGISFGALFTFATTESMAAILVVTLALYGAFSIFGYTTTYDLTPLSWLYSFSFFFFMIYWKIFPIPIPEFLTAAVVIGLVTSLFIVSYETQRTRVFAATPYLNVEQAAAMAMLQSFTLFLGFQISFAGVFFLLFVPRPELGSLVVKTN